MANGWPAEGLQGTLPKTDDFRAFYAETSRTAYSLALRITSNAERAGAATEAAYIATWSDRQAADDLPGRLLAAVRSRALELQGDNPAPAQTDQPLSPYTSSTAVREGLAQVDALGRRAVELAYFGGVGVAQVAELLGQPPPAVRSAMRRALLELGSLLRDEQETLR